MRVLLLLVAALVAVIIEETEGCKLDVLFLVDGSSTLCPQKSSKACPNWRSTIDFVKNIVRSLNIGQDQTRVAFLKYGPVVDVRWDLTRFNDKAELLEAIDAEDIPGGELTSTDSFDVVIPDVFSAAVGDRPDAQNIAILITDDADVTDNAAANKSCQLQQGADATMLMVCLTSRCSEHCAQVVSSPPHVKDVTYFMVNEYRNIESVRRRVEKQLCAKPSDEKCTMRTGP